MCWTFLGCQSNLLTFTNISNILPMCHQHFQLCRYERLIKIINIFRKEFSTDSSFSIKGHGHSQPLHSCHCCDSYHILNKYGHSHRNQHCLQPHEPEKKFVLIVNMTDYMSLAKIAISYTSSSITKTSTERARLAKEEQLRE